MTNEEIREHLKQKKIGISASIDFAMNQARQDERQKIAEALPEAHIHNHGNGAYSKGFAAGEQSMRDEIKKLLNDGQT